VFFVRENLKLRLQGARLAILARQYEAARADLAAAQASLGTWFDPAARRTQVAATLLQQIQGQTKSADLPRIDDSLLALGSAQAAIDAVRK
jgi:uroporphyrin-3 C-methyltransferase